MLKKIDLASWERREIYAAFKDAEFPYYHLSSFVDVTKVRAFSKEKGCTFYSLMIWLANRAANRVENFRYRRVGEEVFLTDAATPSFTTMNVQKHLYQVTRCRMTPEPVAFHKRVAELVAAQTSYIGGDAVDENEVIFFSSVPWLDTTSISNAHVGAADASIPRICWGKYHVDGDRYTLNVFVEVNHQFVDGWHIGEFFRALEEEIDNLTE